MLIIPWPSCHLPIPISTATCKVNKLITFLQVYKKSVYPYVWHYLIYDKSRTPVTHSSMVADESSADAIYWTGCAICWMKVCYSLDSGVFYFLDGMLFFGQGGVEMGSYIFGHWHVKCMGETPLGWSWWSRVVIMTRWWTRLKGRSKGKPCGMTRVEGSIQI